ncbi:MAG: hypothetical protein LCI00_30805 [Chloroflexi bacterium]|nr:hypothetical protein [Chloroflexota bacterium]MCC6896569.1 hypothetical protein [Anaerolineae bacterium]
MQQRQQRQTLSPRRLHGSILPQLRQFSGSSRASRQHKNPIGGAPPPPPQNA